jgi:polyhydroxybutyrate depolymerase
MRKLSLILSLAGLALLQQLAAQAATPCADTKPGLNHVTFVSGGEKQSIDLLIPGSFDRSQRVPLVIGLHPSGGTGKTFDQDTGLGNAATARGYAVMLPDGGITLPDAEGGAGHYWNIPGVPLVSGDSVPSGVRDDVRFIADAIDHVVKNNCVDARRIYVTGFSGGARMSSTLGCRLADRIAAVAPVAGLRAGRAAGPELIEPDASDCRPSRPLPVLAIHGTDDPTNPFSGGQGSRWGYSVERAASRWASLDRCSVTPAQEKVSAHVTRVRYGGCGGGSEVLLYRIDAPRAQGGGHVWPGGSAEIDATEVVLGFFGRH